MPITDSLPTAQVCINDTTLRDGEQSPGCSMNVKEKLQVARVLDELGVDIIEAGFPFASPGDFNAVQRIAESVGSEEGPVICGLARAAAGDIKACVDAVAPAARRRIHTFIATSPIHREHKLRMSKQQIIDGSFSVLPDPIVDQDGNEREPAHHAFPGLAGTDMGRDLPHAEGPTGEVGPGIGHPDQYQQEQQQARPHLGPGMQVDQGAPGRYQGAQTE